MRFVLRNTKGLAERDFMHKLGYQEHTSRHDRNISYIRRAKPGGPFYPRYHCHVQLTDSDVFIDLHYDWRRPLHVKEARSADSRGEVVEKEVARMQQVATSLAVETEAPAQPVPKPKKKGFWGGLFGGKKTLK